MKSKKSNATSGRDEPVVMCCCKNVDFGSYENQVVVDRPRHMKGRSEGSSNEKICIDACIADEIKSLWDLGISTTGCCCGHQKLQGYIGVIDKDIDIMKILGYEVHKNNVRPNDEDSFVPKSTYCPSCQKTIAPSNFAEVLSGEHDNLIFIHDDVHHEDVIGMTMN
jgi:hypothetical protein